MVVGESLERKFWTKAKPEVREEIVNVASCSPDPVETCPANYNKDIADKSTEFFDDNLSDAAKDVVSFAH